MNKAMFSIFYIVYWQNTLKQTRTGIRIKTITFVVYVYAGNCN